MNYYASFGQRFCAALIDAFVVVPILVGMALLSFDSVWVTSIVMIGAMFAIVFYPIVGHAKFGKTIGKHAMGIRVVAVDGSPIGWKQAWLRSSVDVGFMLIGAVETGVELFRMRDTDLGPVFVTVGSSQAFLSTWIDWASWIWAASEVVVMLFNERRRALHDFIAGTIVVREPRVAAGVLTGEKI